MTNAQSCVFTDHAISTPILGCRLAIAILDGEEGIAKWNWITVKDSVLPTESALRHQTEFIVNVKTTPLDCVVKTVEPLMEVSLFAKTTGIAEMIEDLVIVHPGSLELSVIRIYVEIIV
jgi:hypothetical protein